MTATGSGGPSFQDACRFLFPRVAGGTKFSLGPTEALLAALDHPERRFPVVHVGGTNGKGSTVALAAAALRAAGHRVGVYTSPHLVSVVERIVVDGEPITEEAFAAWTARLREAIEGHQASFFEATTAMACAEFARRAVDVAVVEVGLGGRLDSTNVLRSVVAGVTRVALEHQEYLGSDLLGIAREKAGIAKSGVPFLTSELDDRLAQELLRQAEARGARPVIRVPAHPGSARASRSGTVVAVGGTTVELALVGRHQAQNAALAWALLDHLPPNLAVTDPDRRAGFRGCRVPGRFDVRGKWVFDVAHNPDGVAALVETLRDVSLPRPLHALVGVLSDKDWRRMLAELGPVVDRLILTDPPSAPAGRRWTPEAAAASSGGVAVTVERDFDRALEAAEREAATVLVTGSFHTVGDALARLPGFQVVG